ncbi:MAG: cytochrome o ubiquinol oxidase subunit IV [Pseudomonadota bacterium]|nr:cytochrome o ubiquinol oxidase subunit IV [Pseudomonadota bacterium]
MSHGDEAPGQGPEKSIGAAVRGYLVGLALAAILTAAAFLLPMTGWVWSPALPVALVALAVGQMGVHLVFFLHITTGPDNTNNVLALALGVLIVAIVLVGSIWIMAHLNHEMMPMDALQKMQR